MWANLEIQASDLWLAPGVLILISASLTGRGQLKAMSAMPASAMHAQIGFSLWLLAGMAAGLWLASGRSLTDLGLRSGEGLVWQLAWAVVALRGAWAIAEAVSCAVSAKARARALRDLSKSGYLPYIAPRTPRELASFSVLGVTAGITEEVAFRGFLVGAIAVVLPLWPAAAVACAMFLLAHLYQGARSLLQLLPITLLLTALFVFTGSLWPGIVLHVIVDLAGGAAIYFAARDHPRPEPIP